MDDLVGKTPRLLDQVRGAMRTAHYRLRTTEEAYVGWIRRFILFHGKRQPIEIGEVEVGVFFSSDLAIKGDGAAPTWDQLSKS